jgi:hypothetical protein
MTINYRITGPTIKALQATHREHGALVERDGGRLEVVHHLPMADLSDSDVVLRYPAAQWADGLVDYARELALLEGTPVALGTLRATAGRLAADELLEERQREEAVRRPLPRPTRLPRRAGRHAAPMTPDQELLEHEALLDLLEALDLQAAA